MPPVLMLAVLTGISTDDQIQSQHLCLVFCDCICSRSCRSHECTHDACMSGLILAVLVLYALIAVVSCSQDCCTCGCCAGTGAGSTPKGLLSMLPFQKAQVSLVTLEQSILPSFIPPKPLDRVLKGTHPDPLPTLRLCVTPLHPSSMLCASTHTVSIL